MSKGNLYTTVADFQCYADDPGDPTSPGVGDALWLTAGETFLLDLDVVKVTTYGTTRHSFLLVNKNIVILLGNYAKKSLLLLVSGKD